LNDVKPIQSLTIENTSDVDTSSVEVRITADLPCIEVFNYNVLYIPAKKDIKIPLDGFKIDRSFLNKLSETEKANITIEVIEKGVSLVTETITINIYPLEYF